MLKTASKKRTDPAMDLILAVIGTGGSEHEIEPGMVAIGHFSPEHSYNVRDDWRGEHWLWKWDINADEYYSNYGVCDSPEQFKRTGLYKGIAESERSWCVFFTHVPKDVSNAGNGGGWRWHKWGPYIGEGEPTTEYLDDEPLFPGGVYTYHVYELA